MPRHQGSLQSANGRPVNGAIVAFARHRQSLLRRAAEVASSDGFAASAEQCEPLPIVLSLLASSLEALQAAEEELIEQDDSLASARSQLEEQVAYFHRLFDLAPAPLLLTDPFGSVILGNRAIVRLLNIADACQLVDKPIVNLIPLAERTKFRTELSRVSIAERILDWRMTVARRGETPIEVTAAVEIVRGLGRDGGDALHWCLRPVLPSASVDGHLSGAVGPTLAT